MKAEEILQAANEARPDLLEKVATAVALLERFSPEHGQELVEEISTIVNYSSEKTAAADMRGFGLAVGGTLAAGLGAALATDLYDAAKKGLTKGRNFGRIMEANPELKQIDNRRLKTSFDTLHRFVPEFTADPILGGSLLKAVADGAPGTEVQLIKDMVGARKNLIEAKSKQYAPGRHAIERVDTRHQDAIGLEHVRHDLASRRDETNDDRRHSSSLALARFRDQLERDRKP